MRIVKSSRSDKQYMVRVEGKVVHFGDPKMREYPGTKRGDNYCARSYGITDSSGRPTRNDKTSANYWSRTYLWNCSGKKSRANKLS